MPINFIALVPFISILVTLAFAVASVAAPQMVNGSKKFYLVQYKDDSTKIINEQFTCNNYRESSNTSAGFGILACIFVGFAASMLGLALFAQYTKEKKIVAPNLAIAAVFSIISWAVEIHVFLDDFCGGQSNKDNGYTLGGGFACMVITSGLSIVSLVLVLVLGGSPVVVGCKQQQASEEEPKKANEPQA